MAYSEALAERVRRAIGERPDISERKMFGGVAFMAGPNMFCGVMGDELMVRVGPDNHGEALKRPGARIMDFTGRPMKGYLYVGSPGIDSDEEQGAWVEQTHEFASTLPARKPSRRKK